MMNWKGYGRKRLGSNLTNCPDLYLEALKNAINLG
jgi:hypothetical protein